MLKGRKKSTSILHLAVRCDELERKLRFILKEIEAFGLQIS